MALLNRFSKLNDRGETGIFTFIVTKSVTRDLHRDATTKDFCFGYHRWAISFQRPTDKMLGVHLLLRNASPNTACVVDFTLALLNREHFSQNQVYSKRQAKFTITNPMQGVSRWIELSELAERRFSNETGEFLFELSLSNMTTMFECDIQLGSSILNQYKQMLKFGSSSTAAGGGSSSSLAGSQLNNKTTPSANNNKNNASQQQQQQNQLINLETNNFTFGSFEWSLTIVPLVVSSGSVGGQQQHQHQNSSSASSSQDSFSFDHHHHHQQQPAAAGVSKKHHKANVQAALSAQAQATKDNSAHQLNLEPVCRVYLNRLNGFDSLCRVKYRVILGHHQPGGAQSAEFVDSKQLDQISDCRGRIRGHQFRQTNVLKLISLRHQQATNQSQMNPSSSGGSGATSASGSTSGGKVKGGGSNQQTAGGPNSASVDLRVHIEMFCANTISEARVPLTRNPNEPQVSNCSDRNKQAWCVESDSDSGEFLRLKLFFMDLQSVPRNHIRYISWIAHLVRRDPKTGQTRDSVAVRNSPHSNYYLQDGIDLGAMMETDTQVVELNKSPKSYLENNMLTVHIEWIDSLLLFSHLYNNYDALATVQRHQISRELSALQQEFDYLEGKYLQAQRTLNRLSNGAANSGSGSGNNNNNENAQRATTSVASGSNNGVRGQRIHQQFLRTQRQPEAGVLVTTTTTTATTATGAAATTTTTLDNKHHQRQADGRQVLALDELRLGRDSGEALAATAALEPASLENGGRDLASATAGPMEPGVRRDGRALGGSGGGSLQLARPFRELEEEICLIGASGPIDNDDNEQQQGRLARSMSSATSDDRQAAINEASEQQSRQQLPLAYAFEAAIATTETTAAVGMLQKQQRQHNNFDQMLGHRASVAAAASTPASLDNNGRCTSSLSLGAHSQQHQQHQQQPHNQEASPEQLQNNYGHHFSGRLSGGDLSISTLGGGGGQHSYNSSLGTTGNFFNAQGLNEARAGGAQSQQQQQQLTGGNLGVRRSSSIRRRLPQPNVSNLSQQQQQRDRPSSALLPGSAADSSWLAPSSHHYTPQHRGSSGSFDADNLRHHQHHGHHLYLQQQQQQQQQRWQPQLNRNELLLSHRRQSPAGCHQLDQTGGGGVRILGEDNDGMSSHDDDVILVDGPITGALDGGGSQAATFNRFQQPRHSADSAASRLSGTCSPSHHQSGLSASIRGQPGVGLAVPTTTTSPPSAAALSTTTSVSFIHQNQQRMSICEGGGRMMDKQPIQVGQFYQLIENGSSTSAVSINNDTIEQQNRRHEYLLNHPTIASGGGGGSGFPDDQSVLSSDNNDDPRDRRATLTSLYADQHSVPMERGPVLAHQQAAGPYGASHSPFGANDNKRQQLASDACLVGGTGIMMVENEHQDGGDGFVALPLECLSLAQQQQHQLMLHRAEPNSFIVGATRLADFGHSTLSTNQQRHTLHQASSSQQLKLAQLNSSELELRPNRNGDGDDVDERGGGGDRDEDGSQTSPASGDQLMSMIMGAGGGIVIGDANSLSDKSNLKHKPRLMEHQDQYDSVSALGPLMPTNSSSTTVQVNDSNWLAATNHHQHQQHHLHQQQQQQHLRRP